MKQAILWSKDKHKLDQKDEAYRLNQILMYGNLHEINEILSSEGLNKVRQIFILKPIKIYTKPAFNFIKNYILKIDQSLDSSKYVKILY